MHCLLVIDDDDAVLKASKIMLEARGFEVVAVGNGRAGIERVKAGAGASQAQHSTAL